MDSTNKKTPSHGFLNIVLISSSYAYYILSCLTGVNSTFPTIRIITIFILVGTGVFYIFSNGEIYWKGYLFWGVTFLFVLLSSLLYAPQFNLAWDDIFAYIIIFIPVFIMIQTIRNVQDLERFMNMSLYAGVVLSFISIVFYREELFIADRFYGLGNPNSIMVMLLHPVCILVFRMMVKKGHMLTNIIYLVACLIVIFFTGSRKGIVIPFVFTISFLVLNDKRTLLKRLIIIGIVFYIINYLLFNVHELYVAIGSRLELFYVTLFDSDNVTYFSDAARLQLRKDSYAMFVDSPLFGQGVNAVAAKYGTYSHNNYTEILSSLGIIGFCAFYSIYAYCLLNLIKLRKIISAGKDYCDFAISLIIANLAFDWGGVSYNLLYTMTSLSISICIISLNITYEGEINK